MADPKQTSNTVKGVLATIVVAIVAGGSSPWWYDKLFPKPPSGPGAPALQAVMSPLEYNKAYLQADLVGKGLRAASAEDCAALCLNDVRCKAMTYIPDQQSCWVKGTVPESVSAPGYISAVKQTHQ